MAASFLVHETHTNSIKYKNYGNEAYGNTALSDGILRIFMFRGVQFFGQLKNLNYF